MQPPVFDLFPATEPVSLNPGQTSDLFEFTVFAQFSRHFIRFIALWTDNTPPGGPAPTIQLKSGNGSIKSVPADAGDVALPNGAGVASCQSLPRNTYLLTLGQMSDNSGPWSLRVKNNNTEKSLRFAWVSSPKEEDTLRPWLALGESQAAPLPLRVTSIDQFVPVANWGTASVTLEDPVNLHLGGDDSPIVLASRPNAVEPHGVDHIGLRCEQADAREFKHVFASNDRDKAHATVRLTVRNQ